MKSLRVKRVLRGFSKCFQFASHSKRSKLQKRRSRWCKLLNFGNKKRSLILWAPAIFVYSNESCLPNSRSFRTDQCEHSPGSGSRCRANKEINWRHLFRTEQFAAKKNFKIFVEYQWLESSSFVFSPVVLLAWKRLYVWLHLEKCFEKNTNYNSRLCLYFSLHFTAH